MCTLHLLSAVCRRVCACVCQGVYAYSYCQTRACVQTLVNMCEVASGTMNIGGCYSSDISANLIITSAM